MPRFKKCSEIEVIQKHIATGIEFLGLSHITAGNLPTPKES